MVSNTVIITSRRKNAAENPSLELIREFLEAIVLTRFQVTATCPMQLVALPTLQRCVLVCPSLEIAQEAILLHSQWPQLDAFQFQFSAAASQPPLAAPKQFLELPKQRALFLVSPPVSPPPEFDYSRLEESPNRHQGLRPVGHVGAFPAASSKSSHHLHPHHHQVLLHHPSTSITLDTAAVETEKRLDTEPNLSVHGDANVHAHELQLPSIDQFRTAVPPRSIFDDCD
ncbi:LAME_0D08196g1_1 [Lachancea meyersii CBS 8951]|uniref:LAME_0D08196g1_1 n=1 Tax=Lachancea meyersii CBS 8951 TaxID=1266667 RepID=A0A1G4JAV8_9SACH|nr:LAME_0D08196g1_1 [Lachancea meyersii CBS 8951]